VHGTGGTHVNLLLSHETRVLKKLRPHGEPTKKMENQVVARYVLRVPSAVMPRY